MIRAANDDAQLFLAFENTNAIGFAQCQLRHDYKSCKEFASDCEWDNNDSFLFHKALHFSEAGRIICFTKRL